jgi:hypothetical protein
LQAGRKADVPVAVKTRTRVATMLDLGDDDLSASILVPVLLGFSGPGRRIAGYDG